MSKRVKLIRAVLWVCMLQGILGLYLRIGGQEPPVPIALTSDLIQPLSANVGRLMEALKLLGAPMPVSMRTEVTGALERRDMGDLQRALDPQVLFHVRLNPESRVNVRRGIAAARIQQAGYTPVLVKVVNHSTVTKELRINSPQAGEVYAGMTPLSAMRLQREALKETRMTEASTNRFLALEMVSASPMTAQLSGLELEYAIALIYSRDAGKLEATIGFEVGQGTQDIGFRGETSVLFESTPAIPMTLRIRDADGSPTMARLTFRDAAGHVFPPQAKRLAPDFYFQEQVYRRDGESVLLPPVRLTVDYGRGPEYRTMTRDFVPAPGHVLELDLQRWIEPSRWGFYSGDHHIHGAGCAHYSSPSEGVTPDDMFRQVEGEGLNVGCVLTWGPCFDYQRQFFSPSVSLLSRPWTLMKYDLEISGFGSEAMGHVCLLNLRDQNFPNSGGTKTRGWPKWTTPVMRWAKAQGGYTGYAHSGSGLEVNAKNATARLFDGLDSDKDRVLTKVEAGNGLLPESFGTMDLDRDDLLTEGELMAAVDQAAERLPNLAIPEMNGVGAMEIGVSTALGVCDFISAMDTPRIAEWNMWYHLLNCGFPLKVSGETDFPCMSGDRVGQGRVYVQLARTPSGESSRPLERLEYSEWCQGLGAGRSYVSDGFAHALAFEVNGVAPGFGSVRLTSRGRVQVKASVAFASVQPQSVAQGSRVPPTGRRWVGDTVTAHGPIPKGTSQGGLRRVELVINGQVAAFRDVVADGQIHDVDLDVDVLESSWVALRQFPQFHTNPVDVLIGGRPIRASKESARWCAETIRQLWRNRERSLPESERREAQEAFEQALRIFAQRERGQE